MTTPTRDDLLAQEAAQAQAMAETRKQILALEVAPLTAIMAAHDKPTVVALLATLEAQLPDLTGVRHEQASNLIICLKNVPELLAAELAGIDSMLNPPVDAEASDQPEAEAA